MTDPKTTEQRFTRGEPMEVPRRLDRREAERREVSPHQDYLETRLSRFFGKCLAIFAVLGVSCAAGLLGFGIVLHKQTGITDEIQSQRFDSFVNACKDTNARYADVNSKIDDAIAKLPPHQQSAANEKAKPFRLILSAAVPYHPDCQAFAKERVKETG